MIPLSNPSIEFLVLIIQRLSLIVERMRLTQTSLKPITIAYQRLHYQRHTEKKEKKRKICAYSVHTHTERDRQQISQSFYFISHFVLLWYMWSVIHECIVVIFVHFAFFLFSFIYFSFVDALEFIEKELLHQYIYSTYTHTHTHTNLIIHSLIALVFFRTSYSSCSCVG